MLHPHVDDKSTAMYLSALHLHLSNNWSFGKFHSSFLHSCILLLWALNFGILWTIYFESGVQTLLYQLQFLTLLLLKKIKKLTLLLLHMISENSISCNFHSLFYYQPNIAVTFNLSLIYFILFRCFTSTDCLWYSQGSYTLKMTLEDGNNQLLTCISFNFKISFGSSVSASWYLAQCKGKFVCLPGSA